MNLFEALPAPGPEEDFHSLVEHDGVRIERIVSHGHLTPENVWYDQPAAEWVLVLAGAAELQLADPNEMVRLRPGDTLFLAAHRRHRVSWTDPHQPTIWLAVHWPASVQA
jgi:cupin 2 domain-containing protein